MASLWTVCEHLVGKDITAPVPRRSLFFGNLVMATNLQIHVPKKEYDNGPFAGKEVTINKEELFDSNLASFNEAGDLTGGLLYAAKKFGLKLDANTLGSMIKLNPVNRLQPVELGLPKGAMEKLRTKAPVIQKQIDSLKESFN